MNEKETALPDELDRMVKTLKKRKRGKVQIETLSLFSQGDREAYNKYGIFTYA